MVLKDKTGKVLSRSEGEAVMKGRGAVTISILAALLAICSLLAGSNSGKVLTNNIVASDTWNFYQAKSIKQMLAESQLDDAIERHDDKKIADLRAKIARYESDPQSGEGKRELMDKAKKLEKERDEARARGPYYSFSSALLQIAIVLSSTSILAVSMELLWASVAIGTLGAFLLANAVWMFVSVF
jgi:hypothetical protein